VKGSVKRGETKARMTYEDAQRAVIKACEALREAEEYLDSFGRGDRLAVGCAAAEYVAREDQQTCGSGAASFPEVIVNRHTAKFHAGDEAREHFDSFPERIEFRANSEPLLSISISVAQRDFERVLLALQSLLDVVESGSKGGAGGHGCHSSSSVRCGCRTRLCGVVGTSHLTGEEPPAGCDCEEKL